MKYSLPIFFTVVWVIIMRLFATSVSDAAFTKGTEDDLFLPHYARADSYAPDKTVAWLVEKVKENAPSFTAFVTFNADYPTINFYSALTGLLTQEMLLFDMPNREKITSLPSDRTIYLICRDEADLENHLRRFGYASAVLAFDNSAQKIYEVIY